MQIKRATVASKTRYNGRRGIKRQGYRVLGGGHRWPRFIDTMDLCSSGSRMSIICPVDDTSLSRNVAKLLNTEVGVLRRAPVLDVDDSRDSSARCLGQRN